MPTSDNAEFGDKIRGVFDKTPLYHKLTLNFPPVPASRPRVSKWGTYYGKTYSAWRKEAQKQITEHTSRVSGPLTVYLELVCTKPKTTKRLWPRGDVDNYAKSVLDAITTHDKSWEDDDQVISLFITKRFARPDEQPRAVVEIYHTEV